jgi:hypothetical protein
MARIFKCHGSVTQGLPTALSTTAVDILQDDYSLAHSLFTSCAVQVATARPLRRAASNTRPTTSKFIQGPKITMDERDGDFVDQAARCRRLARSIADDAAKPELTGGGIRDDGGLAEERQEN